MDQRTLVNILLGSAFSICILFTAYYSNQEQFLSIILPLSCSFLFFVLLLYRVFKFEDTSKEIWFLIGITKLGLAFTFPQLSDDIYRFWWDGWLSLHQLNPYLFTPDEIVNGNHSTSFLQPLESTYDLLNSKFYYSVYPPFSQLLFVTASSIASKDIITFSIILKIIYLMADAGVIIFLFKILKLLEKPRALAFLYAANPLIQIELLGNLHTEMFMIFFLTVSLYLILSSRFYKSGAVLGLSVLSKLNSLLYAPILIFYPKTLKGIFQLALSLSIVISVLFLILNDQVFNYWSSIKLYFKTFEFNSFIYSSARDWLFDHKYYELKDKLGLYLTLPFLVYLLFVVIKQHYKPEDNFLFPSAWKICFGFLLISSTVHPWYISPLILFSVFCYPLTTLVWSITIFFSYAFYDPHYSDYYTPLTFIEYGVCLCFFFLESKYTGLFRKFLNIKV